MTSNLARVAALAFAFTAVQASAQRATPALAIIVDTQSIFQKCTACVSAQAQLKTQADAIQTRQQALAGPLQTEEQAIRTAANALPNKQPDAALNARINALQQKGQAAQQELAQRQDQFNRNRAYVGQQINAQLNPIIQATMKARGANMAIDPSSVLAYEPALDVTNDVLTQLNARLPSVNVNAPAAPAAPTGR